MEYVVIIIPASTSSNHSFLSDVNLTICEFLIVVNCNSAFFHCSTDTAEVHNTIADFLIVDIAVIPTNVFPEPHGSTIIPDLALPLPNILFKQIS
ncbi:hypothetical protein A0H76_1095 [Hepatospora eriocheir]|uniref:Uncharacterized protein n=1 Tax=Hepatospora eriocheir TaxID=1081669 RepID=A0A1X0QHN2_9MICR|nr:hypothetical protein A0H76_1095 [Hepatospora eriocheir]